MPLDWPDNASVGDELEAVTARIGRLASPIFKNASF
jgi:hypothetical protein